MGRARGVRAVPARGGDGLDDRQLLPLQLRVRRRRAGCRVRRRGGVLANALKRRNRGGGVDAMPPARVTSDAEPRLAQPTKNDNAPRRRWRAARASRAVRMSSRFEPPPALRKKQKHGSPCGSRWRVSAVAAWATTTCVVRMTAARVCAVCFSSGGWQVHVPRPRADGHSRVHARRPRRPARLSSGACDLAITAGSRLYPAATRALER